MMCDISKNGLVIDVGTCKLRAGFVGDIIPRIEIPTVLLSGVRSTVPSGLSTLLRDPLAPLTDGRLANSFMAERLIAEAAKQVASKKLLNNKTSSLKSDKETVYYKNDDDTEENFFKPNHNETTTSSDAYFPPTLTDAVMLSFAQPAFTYESATSLNPYQELVEWLFLTCGVQLCQFTSTAKMALFGTGNVSGLVIDTGHESCRICPIIDGQVMSQTYTPQFPLGGLSITQALCRKLQQSTMHLSIPIHIVENIKKCSCFVSQNIQKDLELCNETSIFVKPWILPDGTTLVIEKERFTAAEILFSPYLEPTKAFLDEEQLSLQGVIGKTFLNAPLDTRKTLLQSMIVCGGPSLMLGLGARLEAEVRQWYAEEVIGDKTGKALKSLQSNLLVHPDRDILAFRGSSLHAELSLSTGAGWVSSETYEEEGMRAFLNMA